MAVGHIGQARTDRRPVLKTFPDDGEIAARVHGNSRKLLILVGERVGEEFVACRGAAGVVAADVYSIFTIDSGAGTIASAVLAIAGPRDREVAGVVDRHGRPFLVVGDRLIHQSFHPGVLRPRIDSSGIEFVVDVGMELIVAVLAVAGPTDEKAARGVDGDRGVHLVVDRCVVDEELAAGPADPRVGIDRRPGVAGDIGIGDTYRLHILIAVFVDEFDEDLGIADGLDIDMRADSL